MLSIPSNLVFKSALLLFGVTAAFVVSKADDSPRYRFADGHLRVDYGEVNEIYEAAGRSFSLENDLSDGQPGAQITILNIEGGCYLSFDWVSENKVTQSDYSYLRISPLTRGYDVFEHTFHQASDDEDRGAFRRYLPEGERYTVSIGAHISEFDSDAYDLEIHNLKIERIELPGIGLVPELETYFFVDPDTDPTGEGTDSTPDPITRPGDTPFIPDTTPVGGGTDYTPDPITLPEDRPTIPDTTPVGEGTDSTPDPITLPEDTPTIPGTFPIGGGNNNLPDPTTLPGSTPTYPDYTSTDNGIGPTFTNIPGNPANEPESGPGTSIPSIPITTSIPTTTGTFNGTGPAPTLPAFSPGPFNPSPGPANGPTGTLETHSVPDSSLGFLGIATLLGLLFSKALMQKSTSRE